MMLARFTFCAFLLATQVGSGEVLRFNPSQSLSALREQPSGTHFDSLTPRKKEGFLYGWTKAIVNYSEHKGERKRMVSMDEWRQFSGLDRNTIFADPLYRDAAARDFRVDPQSPNRARGQIIGALAD